MKKKWCHEFGPFVIIQNLYDKPQINHPSVRNYHEHLKVTNYLVWMNLRNHVSYWTSFFKFFIYFWMFFKGDSLIQK